MILIEAPNLFKLDFGSKRVYRGNLMLASQLKVAVGYLTGGVLLVLAGYTNTKTVR